MEIHSSKHDEGGAAPRSLPHPPAGRPTAPGAAGNEPEESPASSHRRHRPSRASRTGRRRHSEQLQPLRPRQGSPAGGPGHAVAQPAPAAADKARGPRQLRRRASLQPLPASPRTPRTRSLGSLVPTTPPRRGRDYQPLGSLSSGAGVTQRTRARRSGPRLKSAASRSSLHHREVLQSLPDALEFPSSLQRRGSSGHGVGGSSGHGVGSPGPRSAHSLLSPLESSPSPVTDVDGDDDDHRRRHHRRLQHDGDDDGKESAPAGRRSGGLSGWKADDELEVSEGKHASRRRHSLGHAGGKHDDSKDDSDGDRRSSGGSTGRTSVTGSVSGVGRPRLHSGDPDVDLEAPATGRLSPLKQTGLRRLHTLQVVPSELSRVVLEEKRATLSTVLEARVGAPGQRRRSALPRHLQASAAAAADHEHVPGSPGAGAGARAAPHVNTSVTQYRPATPSLLSPARKARRRSSVGPSSLSLGPRLGMTGPTALSPSSASDVLSSPLQSAFASPGVALTPGSEAKLAESGDSPLPSLRLGRSAEAMAASAAPSSTTAPLQPLRRVSRGRLGRLGATSALDEGEEAEFAAVSSAAPAALRRLSHSLSKSTARTLLKGLPAAAPATRRESHHPEPTSTFEPQTSPPRLG